MYEHDNTLLTNLGKINLIFAKILSPSLISFCMHDKPIFQGTQPLAPVMYLMGPQPLLLFYWGGPEGRPWPAAVLLRGALAPGPLVHTPLHMYVARYTYHHRYSIGYII